MNAADQVAKLYASRAVARPHRNVAEIDTASADLDSARAHLGAALLQAGPNDDPIIIGHVRDALSALERCK